MELWLIWLIICAVLVIIEILSQMIWTMCLAVGCLAAMVSSLMDTTLATQIIVMAVAAVIAYFFLMPVFKRWHKNSDEKEGRNARTGMDALLGRRAVVKDEIKPGKLGRAVIDGDNWQVRAPHCDHTIEHGAEVVVTGYDSIILNVEEIKNQK